MTVSKKWLHTKRTTLHFVVRNKQCFPLLLGTKNTFRIFILFSETKSAFIMIKISQIYFLFQCFPLLLGMNNTLRIFMVLSETKSALLPIYSLKFWSFLHLFLWVTWLFFFGQHDSGFGQHDFGQDDFQATWPVPLVQECNTLKHVTP